MYVVVAGMLGAPYLSPSPPSAPVLYKNVSDKNKIYDL